MATSCQQTAYYLNGRLPCLALIAGGVPFPRGKWFWVASDLLSPEQVQELVRDLFPALNGVAVPFAALLTVHDVEEFEREVEESVAP